MLILLVETPSLTTNFHVQHVNIRDYKKFGTCGIGIGYSVIVLKNKKSLLKKSKVAQKLEPGRANMHTYSMKTS
jgi:hypothetical protein